MEIKISTLSENTAKDGFIAEYGLSMFVEADGKKILFDTGLSFSAVHNAQIMGIDLTDIDYIVLSHGHVDHTGGLCEMLRRMNKEVEVIAHPDIWESKYTLRDGQTKGKFIGVPQSREELENRGACFKLTGESVHISEHIITTGEITMITGYEKIENNLLVKESGELHPDKLADDLALIIDTEFGLVVIAGCAHRGIINTLFHAQKLTGKELVYAVIGGIHLFRSSEERIEKTIAELKEMGTRKIGVSHCTGFHATARLAQEFEGIFFLNNAGNRFTLP
ncbi:MAG: MBL fold metallo-hydrolase [Dehalococcoidales bacterium]|nr:MBL fold metallo-hydrolase [Dehalococcoidales bacterium]